MLAAMEYPHGITVRFCVHYLFFPFPITLENSWTRMDTVDLLHQAKMKIGRFCSFRVTVTEWRWMSWTGSW